MAIKVELKDAATVVLLRDGADGLQVLMAKRNSKTRFSAGAYVFPGGAVDPGDVPAGAFCRSVDAQVAAREFGEAQAQRYYLAAARELFEEVGVWMFDAEPPPETDALRRSLHAGHCALDTVLQARTAHACTLSALKYYRFWTTPPGMPRRYRTRFFAALAPLNQTAVVDGIELTELCWTRPQDMLQRQQAREVELIFPTIKELEYLQRFESAEAAWQAICAEQTVEEIRTRHRIVDGRSVQVLMPGEPGYADLPAW